MSRIRDREFVMTHLLRYSDRYFLNLRDKSVSKPAALCLTEILQALICHRQLQLESNGLALCVAPLSVAYFKGRWWLVFMCENLVQGVLLDDISAAEALNTRYTYPALADYDPNSFDWEEIFTNTEATERK